MTVPALKSSPSRRRRRSSSDHLTSSSSHRFINPRSGLWPRPLCASRPHPDCKFLGESDLTSYSQSPTRNECYGRQPLLRDSQDQRPRSILWPMRYNLGNLCMHQRLNFIEGSKQLQFTDEKGLLSEEYDTKFIKKHKEFVI